MYLLHALRFLVFGYNISTRTSSNLIWFPAERIEFLYLVNYKILASAITGVFKITTVKRFYFRK